MDAGFSIPASNINQILGFSPIFPSIADRFVWTNAPGGL